MGKSIIHKLSAAGGETSPKLDARVDQQKYSSWLRQCLNMVPYKSGALTRRVGTQMIAPAKLVNTPGHNYAVNLIDFIFSSETTFTLEFGHEYIRFYSNDAQVNVNSAPTWLTATNYIGGSFVTDPSNNLIYYSSAGINGGTTQPHADSANWVQQTIYEVPSPYNGDALTGSIFDTDVFLITPCQINDVIYLANPNWAPLKLSRFGDTDWVLSMSQRIPGSVLTFSPFIDPALLDQNATDTIITPSATIGSVTLTASAPEWQAAQVYSIANSVEVSGVIYQCIVPHTSVVFLTDLAAGYWESVTIFTAQQVGGIWQLSDPNQNGYIEYDGDPAAGFTDGNSSSIQCVGSATVNTYGVWSSDIAIQQSTNGGLSWTTLLTITSRSDNNASQKITVGVSSILRISVTNSAALVNPGATNPRVTITLDDDTVYGLAEITAISSAYVCSATVITILPIAGTEQWSESAWSNYRGFPKAVCSFQQRIFWASSGFEPQRIWGTVTNDLENFALGDQTEATDSVVFDLNAPSRGPIEWLAAQTDLFAGLSMAEWIINSGSSNATTSAGSAITPTNINAVEQGTFGSAPQTPPLIVGNAVFFAQRNDDAIRQMLFSVYTAKYMSQDLTGLADHLFGSGIVKMAYQSRWRHQSILWVLTQAGTLCGLTYDLDEGVFGWCKARTGYGQFDPQGRGLPPDIGFESVSVIPGKNGNDDEVWVVANRLIGGNPTRFIERINPVNWEEHFVVAPTEPYPVLANAFYVDCGMTIESPGTLTLTGLGYLEGRWVVGLADGSPFGPLLVTGGSVTLPASIPTTVAVVQIGLPIMYAGQPMRFDSDEREGNTQGKVKQFDSAGASYVRVWNSAGGSISNGTTNYSLWFAGNHMAPGDFCLSPINNLAYQCVVDTRTVVDPSQSPDFVNVLLPNYQPPVPINYTPAGANPFAVPVLVTKPTDIRITPHLNQSPDTDPVLIVQGNDALPITVLCLTVGCSINEP